MEDLSAAISHFASDLGLSQSELHGHFVEAGVVAALADLGVGEDEVIDLNEDGVTGQNCGNKIGVKYPDVALPDRASRLGLETLQQAEALFRYNEFGQLTYHRDAEGNVTLEEYFPAHDQAGTGVIVAGVPQNSTGGFLKRSIRDAVSLPGSNSGHATTPVQQTTTYAYGPQIGGLFPRNHRGIATAATDGRGVTSAFLVNQLDQTIQTRRAHDVSQASEPDLVAFDYQTRMKFDANDNRIIEEIQNKNTLDGDDAFIRNVFTFDILDQQRLERRDQSTGIPKIKTRFISIQAKTSSRESPMATARFSTNAMPMIPIAVRKSTVGVRREPTGLSQSKL